MGKDIRFIVLSVYGAEQMLKVLILATAIVIPMPVQAESLLVITRNGTVSIVKDLDALTCKKVLAALTCHNSCFPCFVDDKGDVVYTNRDSTCLRMSDGSDLSKGECLK
jgi:hypothetical protein